jgi:hypothetical protein
MQKPAGYFSAADAAGDATATLKAHGLRHAEGCFHVSRLSARSVFARDPDLMHLFCVGTKGGQGERGSRETFSGAPSADRDETLKTFLLFRTIFIYSDP